jgi:hypothetical protein
VIRSRVSGSDSPQTDYRWVKTIGWGQFLWLPIPHFSLLPCCFQEKTKVKIISDQKTILNDLIIFKQWRIINSFFYPRRKLWGETWGLAMSKNLIIGHVFSTDKIIKKIFGKWFKDVTKPNLLSSTRI